MKKIILLAAVALGSLLVALFLGPGKISPVQLGCLLSGSGVEKTILLQIRLPRILAGFIVGAGLSVAGAALQALLRNPLAESYTLGLSGGASLGICLGILLRQTLWLPLFSFCGAMAAMGLVLGLSQRHRFSGATLVLLGVVLNFIFSSFVLFLLAVSRNERFYQAFFWLIGDLSWFPQAALKLAAPVMAGVTVWLFFQSQVLDALSLGEEKAATLGLSLGAVRRNTVVAASLLTGCSVALSGVVGFVGLIVPHLVRIMLGATHRKVLAGSFLLGGAFLVFADGLARVLIRPLEIPVGVITGFFGGLFFLSLLLGQRGRRVW